MQAAKLSCRGVNRQDRPTATFYDSNGATAKVTSPDGKGSAKGLHMPFSRSANEMVGEEGTKQKKKRLATGDLPRKAAVGECLKKKVPQNNPKKLLRDPCENQERLPKIDLLVGVIARCKGGYPVQELVH